MSICPTCQSEIEITSQHYGTLFTCPKCSVVFFVDWGGQPEAGNGEDLSVAAEEPEAPSAEVPLESFSPLEEPEGFIQDPTEPVFSDSSDLSSIADFGNSDLDLAAFNYTIIISGIDSGALRGQVQEALTDSKFGWDLTQLMTQIKGGVLIIPSVNAVKASILVQRVKYLPVKVRWRQDVLSSTV